MSKTPYRPKSIYRFLGAEAARLTLEKGALREGRLFEFNDLYECAFGFAPDGPLPRKAHPEIIENSSRRLNSKIGVICFCQHWSDPVLWGHYAQNHLGAALEFAWPKDHHLLKVLYRKKRPLYPHTGGKDEGEKVVFEMVRTKSLSWKYESEWRAITTLDECEVAGGHYFITLPPGSLKRVILGYRSPLEECYLRKVIAGSSYGSAQIVRAKKSTSLYEMELE